MTGMIGILEVDRETLQDNRHSYLPTGYLSPSLSLTLALAQFISVQPSSVQLPASQVALEAAHELI